MLYWNCYVEHVGKPMLICSFNARVCLFPATIVFLWKTNPRCSIVCIRDSAELQTGRPLGLCGRAHSPSGRPQGSYGLVCLARQAFQKHGKLWCSESSTVGWDSAEATALQVVRPHWFKVYTINAINAGVGRVTTWMSISHELSCVTVTIFSHKLSDACYWCNCESLQFILPI